MALLTATDPVLLPVTADFGGGIQFAAVNLGVAAVTLLVFSALCRAIEALRCKPTAKGLGTFLARWIPSGAYVTTDGVELRLCGADSTGRV